MVTYYLGNIGAKRRAFRAAAKDSVVCLDNDEVVADFLLDGKVYFVIGQTPGAKLTVAQFIAYARSLKTRLPANNNSIGELLKKAGCKIGLNTPMKKLSRIQYRNVQLAAQSDEDTKTVYANFDGIPYSRANAAKIHKLAKQWSKVFDFHAAVSDFRFVPKKAACEVFLADGRKRGTVPQRNKKIGRARLKWALSRHGMTFCWQKVKSVVLCDN